MPYTKILLTFLVICLAGTHSPAMSAQNAPTSEHPLPSKPKVIFFDVNETLLDLEAMRQSVGAALGGRNDLLPLWFSTMLHYSLVDTVTERYHHFGEIGVNALLMVAKINNIPLTAADAKQAIITPLQSLPPHPDVKEGLQRLKDQGYTLVSLTNSSNKGVQTQFENAGLTQFFDKRLSIEDIQTYKPHISAYTWAAKEMNIDPQDALMVAAHGWDTAGAKAAGMQAIFVARPGKVTYPLAIPANGTVSTITQLADMLEALD